MKTLMTMKVHIESQITATGARLTAARKDEDRCAKRITRVTTDILLFILASYISLKYIVHGTKNLAATRARALRLLELRSASLFTYNLVCTFLNPPVATGYRGTGPQTGAEDGTGIA
jgi:hypothetical protein